MFRLRHVTTRHATQARGRVSVVPIQELEQRVRRAGHGRRRGLQPKQVWPHFRVHGSDIPWDGFLRPFCITS